MECLPLFRVDHVTVGKPNLQVFETAGGVLPSRQSVTTMMLGSIRESIMNSVTRRQVLGSIGLAAGAGLWSGFGGSLHSAPQDEHKAARD